MHGHRNGHNHLVEEPPHEEPKYRCKRDQNQRTRTDPHQQRHRLPVRGEDLVKRQVGLAGDGDRSRLIQADPERGDGREGPVAMASLQPVGEVEPERAEDGGEDGERRPEVGRDGVA